MYRLATEELLGRPFNAFPLRHGEMPRHVTIDGKILGENVLGFAVPAHGRRYHEACNRAYRLCFDTAPTHAMGVQRRRHVCEEGVPYISQEALVGMPDDQLVLCDPNRRDLLYMMRAGSTVEHKLTMRYTQNQRQKESNSSRSNRVDEYERYLHARGQTNFDLHQYWGQIKYRKRKFKRHINTRRSEDRLVANFKRNTTNPRPWRQDTDKVVHGLLGCKSQMCKEAVGLPVDDCDAARFWNRDTVSVLNMRSIVRSIRETGQYPERFQHDQPSLQRPQERLVNWDNHPPPRRTAPRGEPPPVVELGQEHNDAQRQDAEQQVLGRNRLLIQIQNI
ncbi:hypothetical protein BDB00DRAFT_872521 [Zychaea mexicana]|uniref:uncharacterized protein n=1 Tax=Zychaea mexicana TaxID=64656 RepID=UPI0022FEA89E|nr:uncharacterized protein BDB00DRAFT_872521 [Zychaea mexicana]KAI9493215.1 hypothetical protein BDB00DRAFT_872521 [Zychaea mexicana]